MTSREDWSPTPERFGVPWARLYEHFGKEVFAYRISGGRRLAAGRGRLLQILSGKKGVFARIVCTRTVQKKDGLPDEEEYVKTVRLVVGNRLMVDPAT